MSCTYDDVLRVTQESVSGNGLVGTDTVTQDYDALGRPTYMTDNNDRNDANDNSTVEWTYTREQDGDLKVEETQKYGTATDRKVTYEYDLANPSTVALAKAGRLKNVQYPSGLTLRESRWAVRLPETGRYKRVDAAVPRAYHRTGSLGGSGETGGEGGGSCEQGCDEALENGDLITLD